MDPSQEFVAPISGADQLQNSQSTNLLTLMHIHLPVASKNRVPLVNWPPLRVISDSFASVYMWLWFLWPTTSTFSAFAEALIFYGKEDCRRRLAKLGDAYATLSEQRRYLWNVGQAFGSLVNAAVGGAYADDFFGPAITKEGHGKRLRAVVQSLLIVFADDMRLITSTAVLASMFCRISLAMNSVVTLTRLVTTIASNFWCLNMARISVPIEAPVSCALHSCALPFSDAFHCRPFLLTWLSTTFSLESKGALLCDP